MDGDWSTYWLWGPGGAVEMIGRATRVFRRLKARVEGRIKRGTNEDGPSPCPRSRRLRCGYLTTAAATTSPSVFLSLSSDFSPHAAASHMFALVRPSPPCLSSPRPCQSHGRSCCPSQPALSVPNQSACATSHASPLSWARGAVPGQTIRASCYACLHVLFLALPSG
ncbi:hypothetical protein IWX90DRAFT_436586 [Phyllosticta citrichinensis]|uniref:Uncharacterized protein n=1 Tax=Phyllosticta citrichinensis TaxID=1130410 RepID=A0ABR1XRY7_9PEZI